jgi:hypothetical protein
VSKNKDILNGEISTRVVSFLKSPNVWFSAFYWLRFFTGIYALAPELMLLRHVYIPPVN